MCDQWGHYIYCLFYKIHIKHFTYVNSRDALASEKESNYFKYISKKNRTKCFKIKTTDILIE